MLRTCLCTYVDFIHVLGEVAYSHGLNDGVDLGIDVLLVQLLLDLLLLLAVHLFLVYT